MCVFILCFFFFKQKTAYEMRISDWSSDVCSSDLLGILLYALLAGLIARAMPDSWQLPERMATRALAEPTLWDAGTHLMQRASPASWEGIVAAANLARDNRETIEACGAAAAK